MSALLNTIYGGVTGFGTEYIRADDPLDDSGVANSLFQQIFSSGLQFGSNLYDTVYLNLNGMITFGSPFSSYTPSGLSGGISGGPGGYLPLIALYWDDLDTRYDPTTGGFTFDPTGNSTGSNLVYYGATANELAFTWDDVGFFSTGSTSGIAGQIILRNEGTNLFGFDITEIELRYESADIFSSSGAVAGWNVGVGGTALIQELDYVQINDSTDDPSNSSNVGESGIYRYTLVGGGILEGGVGFASAKIVEQGDTLIVTLSDAPGSATGLTYSISGGVDAALFEIDSVTGALSFLSTPFWAAPQDLSGITAAGDNVYEVNVFGTDGINSETLSIAVQVLQYFPPTLEVNTLVDEADGNYEDGDVSFRDALALVADGGTITFAPGLQGTIVLDSGLGDLVINKNLTIDADTDGDDNTRDITIDAQGNSRVLTVDNDNSALADVTIDGLVITGGSAIGGENDSGGGIFSAENLTLTNSDISNNIAASGGGIAIGGGGESTPSLVLTNVTVSGNSASSNGGENDGNGGGIYASRFSGANLTLTNVTISGNSADASGGGIATDDYFGSTVRLSNVTISGNSAAEQGGGLYHQSTSGGLVDLNNVTVSSNTAASASGIYYEGGEASGGEGPTFEEGTLNINSSILANNTQNVPEDISVPGDTITPSSTNSPSGQEADKAIDNDVIEKYLNFDITNTSLVINTSGGILTALALTSAADASFYPERNPTSVVISGSNDNGVTFTEIFSGSVPSFAGNLDRQVITFANTISYTTYQLLFPTVVDDTIANSIQIGEIELLTGQTVEVQEDLISAYGIVNASYSLLETGESYINGTNDSNLFGVDPLLDPNGLQDNGGPTQTIALLPGSPAIDTGSNPTNLTTDQRGFARSVGAGTDIGSFELNQAPSITSANAISIEENTTTVITVTTTDPENATLVYSITGSGADDTLFTIDSSTGALSFVAAPDFEAPGDSGSDNVYDVQVQVSDGVNAVIQDIAVTVTDANEVPEITSENAFTIEENTTTVTTVTATDPENAALVYSITGNGADDALFTIDSSTGALSFREAPDFETPEDTGSDNVYDLQVQVSDGVNAVTQDIAVTVTDANEVPENEVPEITSENAFTIEENTTTVTTVTATDSENAALVYSITGNGVDDALFAIDPETGVLSFIAAPDFAAPGDVGADNIYDVQVQVSDGVNAVTQDIAVTVTDSSSAEGLDVEEGDEERGIITLLTSLTLSLSLITNSTSFANELVAFVVEDDQGTVRDAAGNAITPGTEGFSQSAYLQAILASSSTQLVFSNLNGADTDLPDDFAAVGNLETELSFAEGTRVAFFLVVNGTADDLQNNLSGLEVFFSNLNGALIENLVSTGFSISFGDDEAGIFDDLTFEVKTLPDQANNLIAGINLSRKS